MKKLMAMNSAKRILGLILSIAVLGGVMTGCKDLLDVNTDPTRVSDPPLHTLLPTVLNGTASAHFSTAYYSSQAAHQMDHTGNTYFEEFSMSGAWTTIYLTNLNNLNVMVDKALFDLDETGRNSEYYAGIAKVLQAINLGLLTSNWEDAPWTEALQGGDNPKPRYDDQQTIYNEIFRLLNEAIEHFNTKAVDNYLLPGSDDISYGGDIDKWKRLAYSLLARYQLQVMRKMNIPASEILANVDSGMTSNDDNFFVTYTEARPNPWFTNVSQPRVTGNFSISTAAYLVDLMNGDLRGFFDPRLPIISPLYVAGATEYRGEISWKDTLGSTCALTNEAWHAMNTSPLLIMTYSELKFIEAEVAYNVDKARAYQAYIDGIRANMEMLGVDEADITDYLASTAVAQSEADLNLLDHVMVEKYIANFLHPEVWTDMRRHDFKYPYFEKGLYHNRDAQAQRALYPNTEKARNEDNVKPHIRDFTEKMWRDL